MGVTTSLLATTAVLSGWQALWRRVYEVETGASEVHFVSTGDGWRVALNRYRPVPGVVLREAPVLLCHGLGCNRHAFDLEPRRSLARLLAQRGYDVWVLELRGHGLSTHPGFLRRFSYGWSFDDYVLQDAPAAIERVLALTGADSLHWIGHSMGGLLLYSLMARGLAERVRSGIVVGSSLDYSDSLSEFHLGLKMLWLTRVLPAVPLGAIVRFVSPFSGLFANPLERFNVWSSNVEGALIRRLHAVGFHGVSAPVLRQLASAFSPGGLRSKDGAICYADALPRTTTPVLALAGDEDRQCPPAAAEKTVAVLGQRGRLEVFGREHGQEDHYGHFDLLIGRRAREEVFPVLYDWLEEHA